jgi:hypothetical protein
MTLSEYIRDLKYLEDHGFGDLEVFYRHGASGDCGPIGGGHVTSRVDECGPFDLEEGEKYVSIYVGN